jgi:electron transfer flavoprotein beta subunit
MKILVCISNVPDTTTKITFTDGDTKFNSAGVQFIINPYDEYALTRAIELKEAKGSGNVTVLNVGETDTEPTIRKALAIGADDAIRVNASPKDAFFVAEQIAHIAKTGGYDMILMGRESIDFNGAQIHGLVGEILGIPSISPAGRLDINGDKASLDRAIEGGKEVIETTMPFVAGCEKPMCEPRIPNMRGIMSARTKPLQVVEPVAVDDYTTVSQFELPKTKSGCKMIAPENAGELIGLLRNEAKVL